MFVSAFVECEKFRGKENGGIRLAEKSEQAAW
jgi:hypothetical protein